MITSVFSLGFLGVFIPAVLVAYVIVPARVRWVVLLIAGWGLFWLYSTKLILFLLISTASVYAGGLGIEALAKSRDARLGTCEKDQKKAIKSQFKLRANLLLAAILLLNFGMLATFKYLGFFGGVTQSLATLLGLDFVLIIPKFIAPIGISFYTLMAASYIIDVRRGTVEADRNFGHVALFLCFFPALLEGPICRYGQVIDQLTAGKQVRRSNLYEGVLRIAWGVAKESIVANRINVFIKPVFENYANYDGGLIALAAVLYTLQLYCDFSGAIDIALGTGRIFNVELPENFRQPFFSRSASEFWTRWHITLGTWLRDYIYYPVSLSKPMKKLTSRLRKKLGNRYGPMLASGIALLAVWLANGLWHGSGSQYIFFGMYYFVLIFAGNLITPITEKTTERLNINRKSIPYKTFQLVRTLIIIVIGELFFRAEGLDAGIAMFCRMLPWNAAYGSTPGGILGVGQGEFFLIIPDYIVVILFVVILIVLGILKERGCDVLRTISSWSFTARWALLLVVIFSIVIFGAYGYGYVAIDPIYANF